MDVGSKLKKRRTEFYLTQNEVAEELGVSRQTISNWENGRSYPDIERIIHLSEIYELSLDELLKGDLKMVNQLKRNTKENKFFKYFGILLLINIVLMILLLVVDTTNLIFMIPLFVFISLNTLSMFYLIIKKI